VTEKSTKSVAQVLAEAAKPQHTFHLGHSTVTLVPTVVLVIDPHTPADRRYQMSPDTARGLGRQLLAEADQCEQAFRPTISATLPDHVRQKIIREMHGAVPEREEKP
jgi:hypothetical protein